MSDSFQNEIPKGRVNLTVDVDTGGAKKSVSLPHKTLVLGDFSAGKGKGAVIERERIAITRETRDSVMKELNPELNILVDNTLSSSDEEMQVKLSFNSLNDFSPEAVVGQVPALKRMLAVRNLLKELRSNLVDNTDLKNALNDLAQDPESMKALQADLQSRLSHDNDK